METKTDVSSQFNIEHKDFVEKIWRLYSESTQEFGYGKFYQSLPELGIDGMRPTKLRVEKYHFSDFLNKQQDVLDLGCNCGFLDITIANDVKTVTGVEYNASLVQIAEEVKQYLNKANVSFVHEEYNSWKKHNTKKYDVVFSFAVHHWFGVTAYKYAKDLNELVNSGGLLLFESQDVTEDKIYKNIVNELLFRGFKIEYEGSGMDDGMYKRNFYVLRKKDEDSKYIIKKIKAKMSLSR